MSKHNSKILILVAILSLSAFTVSVVAAPQTQKSTKPSPALQSALLVDQATIDAVSLVRPAVVSILVKEKVKTSAVTLITVDPQTGEQKTKTVPEGETFQEAARGSGIIVDKRGYILTNKHVISFRSALIKVYLANGDIFDGYIVDTDPVNDLAIIKIGGGPYPVAPIGNSDTINIGQTVIAIGYALGRLENTVTRGIISGVGRSITADAPGAAPEVIADTIQTDASINGGNSGGPLVNLRGEVIGINTAIERIGQGVGYAIPINLSKPAIKGAIETGRISRARLGVRYIMITPPIREAEALAIKDGALILNGENGEPAAVPGGPAARAGLQDGDIITEVNGIPLTITNSLQNSISKFSPGNTITLTVLRAGAKSKFDVILDEFPR